MNIAPLLPALTLQEGCDRSLGKVPDSGQMQALTRSV